jgi:hypothetical protein
MLVTAVLVVSFGRLGDIFGRVRMYNLGNHPIRVPRSHPRRRCSASETGSQDLGALGPEDLVIRA